MKDPSIISKSFFKNEKLTEELRKIDLVSFEDTNEKGANERAAAARSSLSTSLAPYAGPWNERTAAHLLKRTLFGVTKEELSNFSSLTMNQAVDQVLVASPFPDPPINNYARPGGDIEDPDIPYGETWVEAPHRNEVEGYRILSLKSWIQENILQQEPTIHQKLTMFWHNLLVTQFWDLNISKASYKYYRTLYNQAFGNFKSLIYDITVDPAMLFYLNGTYSRKEAPDENYARELQELFCIGKGPNSGYTESDVREASRILTGWVVDGQTSILEAGEATSFFYDPFHDTGDKQFSSFYDNRVIEGRSGAAGATETQELIDMLFDNDETALYICRRLYNFFIYHEIDESIERQIIAPLASELRSNNYEILPVLNLLFKSEHFYEAANLGAQIKNPMDHFLGLWRTLGVETSEDPFTQLAIHNSIRWSTAELGMEIGDPPSVSGWQAYYQAPTFDRFWINTDTITKRTIRQDSIVYWGHWVAENYQITADLVSFIKTLDAPDDAEQLVQEISELLLGISLNSEATDGIISVLNGEFGKGYWSRIWSDHLISPEDEEARVTVENRLKPMFSHLMQLSEFQLM